MSDFKFNCPECDLRVQMHVKYAGSEIVCPACNQTIQVPSQAEPGPKSPASPPKIASRKPTQTFPTLPLLLGAGISILAVAAVVFVMKPESRTPAGGSIVQPTDSLPAVPVPERTDPEQDIAPFKLNSNAAWPQWRGPNRDAKSSDTGLIHEWPTEGPPLAWKTTTCGSGYSSVAVAGGLVFTLGDFAEGSHVIAIDEATGRHIWTSPRLGDKGGNYDGTKSTPSIDGDRVYALGQFGDLVCLHAADGSEVWRVHLESDLGGGFSDWNYAESPLVDGNKVIVTPGGSAGSVAALDKMTGKTIWRSRQWKDEPQYVSAIVSNIGGRRHYIQLSQQTLVGLDAESGDNFWRIPRRGATAVIPTPVIYNNIVFVTSGYAIGCNAFQINSSGGKITSRQLYANQDLVNHHGGIVLVDKYVYGHSDRGGWKCLDITTGKVLWENRGVGKGSVVFADGHLICRSETGSGTVALVEATPEGYREKSRFAQPDRSNKNSWAHPVVANGHLYLRDQDTLLCYNLRD
jgi:outer membrane protein assembly factor BamB